MSASDTQNREDSRGEGDAGSVRRPGRDPHEARQACCSERWRLSPHHGSRVATQRPRSQGRRCSPGSVPATPPVRPAPAGERTLQHLMTGRSGRFKGYEPRNCLSGRGRPLLAAALNPGVLGATGPLPAPGTNAAPGREGGRGGRSRSRRSRLDRHYCSQHQQPEAQEDSGPHRRSRHSPAGPRET